MTRPVASDQDTRRRVTRMWVSLAVGAALLSASVLLQRIDQALR
jgi:hypothetical protein